MEDQQHPEEADAVLLMKRLYLPVEIAKWIFEESSNILECSPLLCHITGLSCGNDKLCEITISLLSKGSMIQLKIELSYLPIMSALSLMLGTP